MKNHAVLLTAPTILWQDACMDDILHAKLTPSDRSVSSGLARWLGQLRLTFACDATATEGRSYLAHREHLGPLVIQKTLFPEGPQVCHGVIIHPPGGVAGGDRLILTAVLEEGAKVLLTTPGAGKWYKANGRLAEQSLQFTVQNGANLEWFPQEAILFDGADVLFNTEVNLHGDANYAGWDIVCLGRQARNEAWQTGHYRQRQMIYREGRLIWLERGALSPDDPLVDSKTGLGGRKVFGSFIVTRADAPAALIEACRAECPDAKRDSDARVGITVLPELLVIRYVGNASQSARQYFERIWQHLRPWYLARAAVKPRIWNT